MSGVALSWSGGKDSALALWTMREEGDRAGRPADHPHRGLRPDQHARRAPRAARGPGRRGRRAAGRGPASRRPARTRSTRNGWPRPSTRRRSPTVEEFAFADLFLADIRAYREERLAAIGRRASFPVWGRETGPLARTFVDAGFEATLVCVDPKQLDASFCGRAFDADLLRDLPDGVDPCGENGEFHTFVTAGPIFSAPVPIEHGETVERDGFVFHDLKPA